MLNEREIKVTTDYGMFKRMKGNRSISQQRETMILKSISEYGYIGAPILVNEKMEVVDGQGRLNACKELGIPIPYCVKTGADVTSCMVLNRNTRNWTDEDYIKSFAEQGNESYKLFLGLMERYELGVFVTFFAVKLRTTGGGSNSPIRRGTFQMTTNEYLTAYSYLGFLSSVMPYIRKSKASTQKLSCAVLYALNNPLVDDDRLESIIKTKYKDIEPYARLEELLEEVSRLYNHGLRGKTERVWLKEAYQKAQYED